MGLDLRNCDCMELMSQFPDHHFDLAIVDPPYGIGAENHAGPKEHGWTQWPKKSWDSKIPDKSYFKELFRVSKNQIVWGGNYFTEFLPASKCWIVWDKGQRDFSLADGELAWCSFDKSMRIYELPRAKANQENKLHPTQKPVDLYRWVLDKFAKQGNLILDTHLGSGSIAIACHDYKFDLVASEIDTEYYEATMKRVSNHLAQTVLF